MYRKFTRSKVWSNHVEWRLHCCVSLTVNPMLGSLSIAQRTLPSWSHHGLGDRTLRATLTCVLHMCLHQSRVSFKHVIIAILSLYVCAIAVRFNSWNIFARTKFVSFCCRLLSINLRQKLFWFWKTLFLTWQSKNVADCNLGLLHSGPSMTHLTI